ncbi:peroxidase 6-like [Coffea arabica]|uniref:Peroxidase n=1 Tax=Coffea arabica TaxID=13443 RepID=A0A6P6UYE6_COFAR|nr:peroxidase 6-like [Coffea arabica]
MILPLFLPLFLVSSITLIPTAQSKLSLNYYSNTCPAFLDVVQQIITDKQLAAPTTAAATLRLFFHDCMVGGCDASLLISSTSSNNAERDADDNRSLPGDGFDVIVRAKTALELRCPGIVSCADILAVATRDLVTMVGGPFYDVRLGRKDSFTSHAIDVKGHLATPNMSITEIINIFASRGLDVKDMVALSGAHTIGFSHCSQFSHRIFNFSKSSQFDPSLNPKFARELQKLCANYTKDEEMSAFNDVMTPGKFDNMYYSNLQKGLGVLVSDQALASDPRAKPFVDLYAANQTAFFRDFAHAMEKVSVFSVKTGKKGEVRHRCDASNNPQAS